MPVKSDSPNHYNGTGSEVILQGFHWTSYNPSSNDNKVWYQIISENADVIKGAKFDYVWFPPPSASAAQDNSYLPTQWFTLNNGYGTTEQLKQAVAALKPTKALCDIVINHRCGTATGQGDFTNPTFGNPAQNRKAIVKGDECNCGIGNTEEKHRDGVQCESNSSGRDLDHTNPLVQSKVKEFLQKLKNDIGFAGWRYDQVKGYNGFYVGMYNDFSNPELSVGEFWHNDAQTVVNWVDETEGKSMAFDFPTRDILARATLKQDYSFLKTPSDKAPGLIGLWPEMSVTFIENHDTESIRDSGNKRFPDGKTMEGYAYILTHPGIPCVFWRHFFDQGQPQKERIIKLIALRKDLGISSRSDLVIQSNTKSVYAAIIDNKLAVKLGTGNWSPGQDWKLLFQESQRSNYSIWIKNN